MCIRDRVWAIGCCKFIQAKTVQFLKRDPTRQALGGMSREFRCGAAQNQEACRRIGPVGQYAQQGKEVRPRLDFVQELP